MSDDLFYGLAAIIVSGIIFFSGFVIGSADRRERIATALLPRFGHLLGVSADVEGWADWQSARRDLAVRSAVEWADALIVELERKVAK